MSSGSPIDLDAVRFHYAPDGWSLDLPRLRIGAERFTCIVGPNGSGKSTLLRLAAGLLKPVSGTVRLDGKSLAGFPRRALARRIGFLPQESPPLFDYAVEEVVRLGRYVHSGWFGEADADGQRAVDKALSDVGLTAQRLRPLSHLSGGERKRAMIAAVLAQESGLLLLDEPTAALDIHHAAAVMRLLARLGRRGRAVVVVTHELNLAALFAERLLLLVGGRVIADGPPSHVVRAEVLREAYGDDIMVREHPETGGPLVVARRCGVGDAGGNDAD